MTPDRQATFRLVDLPFPLAILAAVGSGLWAFPAWSLQAKLTAVLVLVVGPMTLAAWEAWRFGSGTDPGRGPFRGTFSPGAWVGLGLAGLWLRMAGLFPENFCPSPDEGWLGGTAIDLAHGQAPRFFENAHHPFAMYWLTALAYRFTDRAVWAIAVPNLLISVALVGMGTWAVTRWTDRSWAFPAAAVLATQTWWVYLGRVPGWPDLLVLAEVMAFGALGAWVRADDPRDRARWALGAGFLAGTTSWTYAAWPVVTLFSFLSVMAWVLRGRVARKESARYFAGLGAALLPFGWGVLTQGFGGHAKELLAWNGHTDLAAWVVSALTYGTQCVWGPLNGHAAYSPTRLPFFDPLASSLLFLGLLEGIRTRRSPLVRGAFFASILFLSPGWLTMNTEMCRVAPLAPLLAFWELLGLRRLGEAMGGWGRKPLVWGLAVVAFLWCGFQMGLAPGSTPVRGETFGPPARNAVLETLRNKAAQEGPGWFLFSWAPCPWDQATWVGAYEFNAACHPQWDPSTARWAAFVVNVNALPFLKAELPGAQWVPLDPPSMDPTGGSMLVLAPMDRLSPERLAGWRESQKAFRDVDRVANRIAGDDSLEPARRLLRAMTPPPGDRLLRMVYWEKMAWLEFRNRRYEDHVRALRNAIAEGYPSAHLFYQLGSIEVRKRRFAEARADFESARKAPLDLTGSSQGLALVDRVEKNPELIRDEP